MGLLRSNSLVCPIDRHCSISARVIMGYCLCGNKESFSLALGLVSVVSWGVAEVPQLITNYRTKSAEGLSIFFLVTWIVGDFFNLFGCILEPATLPTQYYMAVLYTITTIILFSQAVYYGHIYTRLKSNRQLEASQPGSMERRMEQSCGVDTEKAVNGERLGAARSSPIPVASASPNRSGEPFFMSARSLSVCYAPPGSFLGSRNFASEVDPHSLKAPLLGEVRSPQSAPPPKIKTMLCVVSLMTFILSTRNQQLIKSHKNNPIFNSPTGGIVLRVGRHLSEVTRSSTNETRSAGSNGIGTYFGWGMAAIYMGGRLPQIFLNFRRGNAEGLNPLMFVFALVGNTTYVSSILVRSLNWSKIRPNLPWLVESGGCVFLDIFILVQFFYYRYRSRSRDEKYLL